MDMVDMVLVDMEAVDMDVVDMDMVNNGHGEPTQRNLSPSWIRWTTGSPETVNGNGPLLGPTCQVHLI